MVLTYTRVRQCPVLQFQRPRFCLLSLSDAQLRSAISGQSRQRDGHRRLFGRFCRGLARRSGIVGSTRVHDGATDTATSRAQHPRDRLARRRHGRRLVHGQRHLRQQRPRATVCRTRPNCAEDYRRQLSDQNCRRFHVQVRRLYSFYEVLHLS